MSIYFTFSTRQFFILSVPPVVATVASDDSSDDEPLSKKFKSFPSVSSTSLPSWLHQLRKWQKCWQSGTVQWYSVVVAAAGVCWHAGSLSEPAVHVEYDVGSFS